MFAVSGKHYSVATSFSIAPPAGQIRGAESGAGTAEID
jgi:hypothetical protein